MNKNSESSIFQNLFVLEMANNHWGDVARGKRIIRTYAKIVRRYKIKAAIKMQFRDVDTFIHPNYKGDDERYIKKTESTRLSFAEFRELTELIIEEGCIPMATPFDEKSVGWCEDLSYPIIKIASSDINDWRLLNRVAKAKKAVIISTGGATEDQIDRAVSFFDKRHIALAINHCVSLYPSEDSQLELSQIDYLKFRYPEKVIGLSTHEYNDWSSSLLMSYAKGARTWERHIDIDDGNRAVSPYCSLPHQIEEWFCAFKKAQEMDGHRSEARMCISQKETDYLDNLARGLYARRKISSGTTITRENLDTYFFQAIPLQKGQLSGREDIIGATLSHDVEANDGLFIEQIANVDMLHDLNAEYIQERGRKRDVSIASQTSLGVHSNNRQTYMSKLHLRMA